MIINLGWINWFWSSFMVELIWSELDFLDGLWQEFILEFIDGGLCSFEFVFFVLFFFFLLFFPLKLCFLIFLEFDLLFVLFVLSHFALLFFLFHFHFSFIDFLFAEEILTCFHFDILLPGLLFWREGSVLFFLLSGFFLLVNLDLFELRQEPVPIFALHIFVFEELPFNHQLFNVINRMNILHGVDNDSLQHFNILKTANDTNSTSLNQDVTFGQ